MRSNPSGLEGMVRMIRDLQHQINVMRGAAGIKSAVLQGDTIRFEDLDGLINLLVGNGATEFYSAGVLNARIGDGFSRFYGAGGGLNAQVGGGRAEFLDGGIVTALIGEFAGQFYNQDTEDWEADTMRGFALIRPGDAFPYLMAGHALGANRLDISAGFNGGSDDRLDSFQIDARHTTLHGGDDPDGDCRLSMQPSGQVILESTNLGQTVNIGFSVSNVTLSPSASGSLKGFNLGSHAIAANLSRDPATGIIRTVASARKYKTDIEDAVIDPADVLKLRPRTWIDKGQQQRYERELVEGVEPAREGEDASKMPGETHDPIPPTRHVGFIAEEVAEQETLQQLVQYNEDGTVESLYYDRFVVGLLELAKQQQAEIDELRSAVDALASQLRAV